jgi:hypothetical protein
MKRKVWNPDTIVVFDRKMTSDLLALLDICRTRIPGMGVTDRLVEWIYEQLPDAPNSGIVGTGSHEDPWRKA